MQSRSTEDYLKAIYALQQPNSLVSTTAIADLLGIKSSSVTEMLGKMENLGLVYREKYKGARLTKDGHNEAVLLIRKHRLWETFLVDKLKFGWDEVHKIAEQLEHVKSKELVERLDNFLGRPSFDPHGDPIPDKDGQISEIELVVLSEADKGKYVVRRILDDSTELLEYISFLKIGLGTSIELVARQLYDSSVAIKIEGDPTSLSETIAGKIALEKIK